MASKSSPQYTEHNDKSRIVLPCIGEDELLNQPAPSSRGSIPKTLRQRLRVNSEPIVSNAVKNTLIKSKDAVDDATAKSKMTINRKVTRRGLLQMEFPQKKIVVTAIQGGQELQEMRSNRSNLIRHRQTLLISVTKMS